GLLDGFLDDLRPLVPPATMNGGSVGMPLDTTRILVLVLLGLPLAAAAIIAGLGAARRDAIRWIALGAVTLNLLVTGVVVFRASNTLRAPRTDQATFEPLYVPGDPGMHRVGAGAVESHSTSWDLLALGVGSTKSGRPTTVQFFIGLDGLNIWLLALTSFLLV